MPHTTISAETPSKPWSAPSPRSRPSSEPLEIPSAGLLAGRADRDTSDRVSVNKRLPTPYIDTRYFEFRYGGRGDLSRPAAPAAGGERPIDCQDWSAAEYVSTTMMNNATVFGVNFADGRIKGYPKVMNRREGAIANRLYVRYVRGNPDCLTFTAQARSAATPRPVTRPTTPTVVARRETSSASTTTSVVSVEEPRHETETGRPRHLLRHAAPPSQKSMARRRHA